MEKVKFFLLSILGIGIFILVFAIFTRKDMIYNQKIKDLQHQNSKLELYRKTIDHKIDSLNSGYLVLVTKDSLLLKKLEEREKIIIKAKIEAEKTKEAFDKISKDLTVARKQIQDFHPPNRTGEDLLNSLTSKTR